MGSFSVARPTIQPIEQPDALQNYGRLLQLKGLQQQQQTQQQLAPLQVQAAQQQSQLQQQQIQMGQQEMAARQALNQAYAGAVTKDESGRPVFDSNKLMQSLSTGPAAYKSPEVLEGITKFQKGRIDLQTAVTDLQSKSQEMVAGAAAAIKAANYDPVLAHSLLDSLPQSPQIDQIRQQIDNPQALKQYVDAAIGAAPKVQQQLAQTASEQANAAEKNMVVQQGGTTDADKFISNFLKSKGLPDTPENHIKAFQEYTKETKIAPAMVRVEGYAQSREMPVIDTANGNALVYASAADINHANQTTPGRFVPASEGGKALNRTALIEDIRGNLSQVRDIIKNPKLPEFTSDQRAAVAVALGAQDSNSALTAAFRGGVLGSLTPEQQDYLINMAQLKENAMAMRSVLGAGQGSEDLRNAILATLPGPRTPSKLYASKQLDAFENVLNRLEKGIAKVPLTPGQGGQPSAAPSGNNDPLGIR